jgi:hypothetical protein
MKPKSETRTRLLKQTNKQSQMSLGENIHRSVKKFLRICVKYLDIGYLKY